VMLSLAHDFENYLVFKEPGPGSHHEKSANVMLGQVVAWSTALQSMRRKG